MRLRAEPGFPRGAAATWRAATPPVRAAFRWWFSLEIDGAQMPEGPAVVAGNHFSHLDPIVVSLAVGRPTRFLAVDELFGRSRMFDGLTLWLGTVPMTRTRVPFGPLKTALAELAAGGTVGLFPEGVRVWHWGEREPKRGAAWLARRAGVPLVPVAVVGSDLAMGRGTTKISRAPLRVVVCDPIDPSEYSHRPDPVGAMSAAWAERIGRVLEDG